MIKLYREEESPQADMIEAEFREMVLGYDLVSIEALRARELFGTDHPLPVITDNELMVSGEAIQPYLKELGKFTHDWQLFQGSCCHIDDE